MKIGNSHVASGGSLVYLFAAYFLFFFVVVGYSAIIFWRQYHLKSVIMDSWNDSYPEITDYP